MNSRCLFLQMLNVVTLTVFGSGITIAEEIIRWEFSQEPVGWEPNSEVQLSVEDGHLKVGSHGNDPYLTATVAGRAGDHRITIAAQYKGDTKIQVFGQQKPTPLLLSRNLSVVNYVVQNARRGVCSCILRLTRLSHPFGLIH